MENKTKKATLTKGASASGKSTWASEFIASNPDFVEINRDNIRLRLFGREKMWSGDEKLVTKEQRKEIVAAYAQGRNVIVSDTNLNKKFSDELVSYLENLGYKIEWKDFTDVPLVTLLERDSKREFSVGEKVIKEQYRNIMRVKKLNRELIFYVKQDMELQPAVLCDVDGTLTTGPNDRSPYDWSKVSQDQPHLPVVWLVQTLAMDKRRAIIFVSGRDEVCRKDTEEWIRKHVGDFYFRLLMRPQGDMRKDSIVKEEIYNNFIKDEYFVEFVLDDRQQVVDTWRSLGLPCFQVAPGNF
ncbi:MAG TPA: AAA family ATPase [Leptospiraceae bacterium]|nr:AAA family ATPase [Leptospiraceae bacterium]